GRAAARTIDNGSTTRPSGPRVVWTRPLLLSSSALPKRLCADGSASSACANAEIANRSSTNERRRAHDCGSAALCRSCCGVSQARWRSWLESPRERALAPRSLRRLHRLRGGADDFL